MILAGEREVLNTIYYYRPASPFIAFDVGANVGDYTNEVVKRVKAAEITAFEPQPEAATMLRQRFPDVTVEQCALGKRNCLVNMYRDRPLSYHASNYRMEHEILGTFYDVIAVDQRRLDDYCAVHKISHIDLLKIDVEGSEMDVLEGAGHLVGEGRTKLIQFEYNDNARLAGLQFMDFWMFFLERDYRLYRETDIAITRIKSYRTIDEAYRPDRNYFAIHASVDWWPDDV